MSAKNSLRCFLLCACALHVVADPNKFDFERDGIGEMADNGGGGGSEVIAVRIERFQQVQGFDGRTNDVIYCSPLTSASSEETKVVVYFGGDVQDLPELMALHRDNRHYAKYDLESTAILLRKQFPEYHIVVVRPSRMQLQTFSCFDNFVPCTNNGAPEHTPNNSALVHLELVLKGLSERIGRGVVQVEEDVSSTTREENVRQEKGSTVTTSEPRDNPRLDQGNIALIGFSKGAVVLNQFLYEFHYLKTLTPDDDSMEHFLSRMKDMYWLDGGHNGGKNAYITSRSLLETLKRLNIKIHVHMTPYQLRDERRDYIAKEEKLFSQSLIYYGAWVRRYVHFEDENPSLDLHFKILEEFKNVEEEEVEEEEEIDEDEGRDCSIDSIEW